MKIPARLLACTMLLAASTLHLTAQNQPAIKAKTGDRLPIPKKQVMPNYPFEMHKEGITGTVQVRFIVSKKGDVLEAEVVDSPNEAFAKAALAAVSKWKYEPGLKNGVPVAVRLTVPIQFNLQDPPNKKPQP